MRKVLMMIAVSLALPGCAGAGPSKADVEAALIKHFEQASGGMRTTFQKLEVGTCQKAESAPGYACSVNGQAQIDVGGRLQKEALTATFVFEKVGDRWTVVSAH
ncbi:hypothetical protein [Luteimonas fraxinea]|uniref:hypothetical protein n=1 Tax=Luteimonas fraxinea TaxID=2901869 RepID=UPI001E604090|nr:hypothetical protein [Luteimonas fraxinea]MCD9125409.1 hypothetical protein [Luteimonas fraxinea]